MHVLMLLAPSKTMDFTTALPYTVATTKPVFSVESAQIAQKISRLSVPKIIKLMHVSRPIAEQVHAKYASWQPDAAGRPALWSYRGDVYKGMRAWALDESSANWAQQHLLIASGLYGLLRPFDEVQAYRLEMKAQLSVGRSASITSFWQTKLPAFVAEQGSDWLCNLSSKEYSKPALHNVKEMRVVTPEFFDTKPNGTVGTVPIYSKMMRGVLCRWMIDQRVSRPEQLQAFVAHGYSYDAGRSRPSFPAFSRTVMKPLVFD